jgi:hypothetical protein
MHEPTLLAHLQFDASSREAQGALTIIEEDTGVNRNPVGAIDVDECPPVTTGTERPNRGAQDPG